MLTCVISRNPIFVDHRLDIILVVVVAITSPPSSTPHFVVLFGYLVFQMVGLIEVIILIEIDVILTISILIMSLLILIILVSNAETEDLSMDNTSHC